MILLGCLPLIPLTVPSAMTMGMAEGAATRRHARATRGCLPEPRPG